MDQATISGYLQLEREREIEKERHTVSKSWCQGPFTGKDIGQEVCTDACHGYRDQLPSWYWNSTTSICNTISPRKICNPQIRDIWDSAVCYVDSTQIGNAVIALIHHPSWSKTEELSKNSKHKKDTSVRNRNCRHSFEPSSVIKNHLIHTWRRTGQFIAFLHSSRCEYSYPGGVLIPHLPQSQIQSTKLSQSRTYIHSRQSKPSPNVLRQLLEDNELAAKTVEGSKPKKQNQNQNQKNLTAPNTFQKRQEISINYLPDASIWARNVQ